MKQKNLKKNSKITRNYKRNSNTTATPSTTRLISTSKSKKQQLPQEEQPPLNIHLEEKKLSIHPSLNELTEAITDFLVQRKEEQQVKEKLLLFCPKIYFRIPNKLVYFRKDIANIQAFINITELPEKMQKELYNWLIVNNIKELEEAPNCILYSEYHKWFNTL
jgi:hypothetical protein